MIRSGRPNPDQKMPSSRLVPPKGHLVSASFREIVPGNGFS